MISCFRRSVNETFWDLTQRRLVAKDVSGQPIGPIFKSQTVKEERLTLEDGMDRLSRNVGK